jgi:hypothetical protein
MAAAVFALGFIGQNASAQESAAPLSVESPEGRPHLGYPQDWSSHYLVMPGVKDTDARASQDPRIIYNMVMREMAIRNQRHRITRKPKPVKVDWAVSLENGFVPFNQFPAKYRFDVTTEDCNKDFVLFGLSVTSGAQATLVGINNLYTEATPACNSGKPWVSFAYNTKVKNGQIKVSPVLSADGTKVAFIESANNATYFHVLVLPNPIPAPPSQTGTVLAPQTPATCTTPTTAGCMTTLIVVNSASDSNSSPWVDYNSDTAYVGADNGKLYKITPVFNGGAPALVSNADWPVTVSQTPNSVLTDPIYDPFASRLYMGDGYGYLYAVSSTAPGGTFAAQQTIGWVGHGSGTGVVDPPIVINDPANSATDQVFAFTGCSSVIGIGGAVTQLPANFSTGVPTTANTVDLGSASGIGDCTTDNLHAGTFDNAFFVNGSKTGHLITCGFVSGTANAPLSPSNPQMYFFPFVSNVITSTGATKFVINNTLGDECSELTEFYNGTIDRLFFGVGGTSDGFIESSTITTSLTKPNCTGTPTTTCVTTPSGQLGGTSGIVVDNQVSNGGTNIYFTTLSNGSVNGQKCNVTGGSSNPYCAVKLTQAGLK